MARPKMYDWESIEKAYEQGAEVNDICKKYKVSKKTLQNKISEKKWQVKGTLNSQINEFREVTGRVLKEIGNNPETEDINTEKVLTILEDNALMTNNRKLLKAIQGIIGSEIRNNKINASNVKAITGAIRDIEYVANPKPETLIQNTNAQQNNIAIDWE